MELEIIIAEPWNFKSSDGDNYLKVKVIEKKKGIIKAEALSDYLGKGGYLIITQRNIFGNVNICQISDNGEITYGMIGTYADKYSRKNNIKEEGY
ncbi:MAG: hypothetical protein IJ141_11085 [Lachnospiraceae bacterium]|nr:hypothetical protein [Lachnospiraceae bacterium]